MRTRTASLESILASCQRSINDLTPLLSSPFDDVIEKRCVTRKMIILAEALTFIKNNKDQTNLQLNTIKNLKSETEPNNLMLDELNAHRNKLAHHYIAEHLLGDEKRFDAAAESFRMNLHRLVSEIESFNRPNSTLHVSQASPLSEASSEDKSDEIKGEDNRSYEAITKAINKTPEDKTGLTVLDYANLILLETAELENIFAEFNCDINDKNSLTEIFNRDEYKQHPFLKEAILNCFENILTLYKGFNTRYFIEEEKSGKKYNESVLNLSNQITSQKNYLFNFIEDAARIRKNSVHNFESMLDDKDLKVHIIKVMGLKKHYFEKTVQYFKDSGIQFNKDYSNLLSPLSSAPSVSASEAKSEISNNDKSESKYSPFKPRSLSIKRYSADLSIEQNKKLKEGKPEEAGQSEIAHEERLQNFMKRNPSLTGYPLSNPKSANTHSEVSSTVERTQDDKQEGDDISESSKSRPRI